MNALAATFAPTCSSASPVETRPAGRSVDLAVFTLKAIAILAVASHHLANRRLLPEVLDTVNWVTPAASWCVLAFMAISGWLHAVSRQKSHFAAYLLSLSCRLLVPFVGFTIAYCLLFQLAQTYGQMELRSSLPPTLAGKLHTSLWPRGQEVAEHLYFLPLLFCVNVFAHLWEYLFGPFARWAVAAASLASGCYFFPHAGSTGFTFGVFVWCVFSYSVGMLACGLPDFRRRVLLAAACTFTIVATCGPAGWVRCVAPAALAVMPLWRHPFWSFLHPAGEASGTVYVYHTPFVLQPLLILASLIAAPAWQLAAVFGALVVAVLLCTLLHYGLRQTRLSWVLL